MTSVVLDKALTWEQIAAIANGAPLSLSAAAQTRIEAANAIVRSIVMNDIRAYGVNTGVGALSDVVIPRELQCELSHNILMSHAVGVGRPLAVDETRAIMAAAVNNFAHGYSGLRVEVVDRLIDLLNAGCVPEVLSQGSVGYISHMAQIGLVLIGHGHAISDGVRLTGAEALAALGLVPLTLEAKEGLCLVNGTPCGTGLACLALNRAVHLMDWADTVAAMTFETQRCQFAAIDAATMGLKSSPGTHLVQETLTGLLAGSGILTFAHGRKTQDALSLRSIPHVHGAVRDVWANAAVMVDRELASVTDNPAIGGTPEEPAVFSQAHAVGAGIGLAMDTLAIAVAELGAISERRLDRMVNPLVSGLPPFLTRVSGVTSGFMIAQYTSVSLVADNRRLAAPASLDGGVTSALQEDMLCHAAPAALKALLIVSNVQNIIAIELLAACQSYDLIDEKPASGTEAVYQMIRSEIASYSEDHPLGEDIACATNFIQRRTPIVGDR
jgi:histidine ammonia-lyase